MSRMTISDPVAASGSPVPAGAKALLSLAANALKRYVAVRAVDDQGNVGRPAVAYAK